MTRDAVIVGAVRTPVGDGKPAKGLLSGINPADLSALVLDALVERTGVDPALVDDVIWGCVSQVGEQSSNIGRTRCWPPGGRSRCPGHRRPPVRVEPAGGDFAADGVIAGQYDVVDRRRGRVDVAASRWAPSPAAATVRSGRG